MNSVRIMSAIGAASLMSFTAEAATTVADGRGNGMGNTGVTTANYIMAPFYNPALVAIYRDKDNFGLLLPAIGAELRDNDNSLNTIDDLQDSIKALENGDNSQSNLDKLNGYLDDLSGNKPLNVSAGVSAAFAIPHEAVSSNVFARGYAEIIGTPNIAANTGNSQVAVTTRYQNSDIDLVAFGYLEFGVALAKRMTVYGQDMSFGITPKIQRLRTYKQNINVNDFDVSDYDKTETTKNSANLDLGAVWMHEQFRAGVAVKDLFSQKIDTQDVSGVSTYKLDTQVTVSGAFAARLLTATVDLDLTKQSRFTDVNDDTKFLRFGVEGNAWDWVQLRAGYQIDMEDTLDNSVTAGVGLSPGDLVSIDIAGSYAGEHEFGLSANLEFTF
ncbi:conjugal transfer protein TraF [Vibrio sp. S4M6]|uniref:conjugal transfer protein TraF n=1 Tax=Vibrio sinus TaxID=2946865 RepID=UPI002029BE69|nr:conjugal transfer protein TraF [Vibrio sinus]MCL9779866.1 conjugal transfer protein TraF [Vibrio sinus]